MSMKLMSLLVHGKLCVTTLQRRKLSQLEQVAFHVLEPFLSTCQSLANMLCTAVPFLLNQPVSLWSSLARSRPIHGHSTYSMTKTHSLVVKMELKRALLA